MCIRDSDKSDTLKGILRMLESEVQLRSKRELIEKFISDQMPKLTSGAAVKDEFDTFWKQEQESALDELCEEEGLFDHEVQKIVADINFSGQSPLRETIVASMKEKPRILERKTVIDRVTDKIMKYIRTFDG